MPMELIFLSDASLATHDQAADQEEEQLAAKFQQHPAQGLLYLSQMLGLAGRSASLKFWHSLVVFFLRRLCTIDENSLAFLPPDPELSKFANNYAPFTGAQFLTVERLNLIWESLTQYIASELKTRSITLRQFLAQDLPTWSQAGLLHFHLAENPNPSEEPFVFLATLSTKVADKTRLQHRPLGQVLKEVLTQENQDNLDRLLKPLRELSQRAPFVASLLQSKAIFQTPKLPASTAYRLLCDLELCEEAGVVVNLPKSWLGKKPAQTKLAVSLSEDEPSFVGFDSLFRFRAQLAVDDMVLSKSEIDAVMAQNADLVQIRGRWVRFDREAISHLLSKWHKANAIAQEGLRFSEALRLIAGANKKLGGLVTEGESDHVVFDADAKLQRILTELRQPENLSWQANTKDHVAEINAVLRPYQEHGVKWLYQLSTLGLGGCLADDMGLGKTLQLITLLWLEKKAGRGPNLLVMPASLLGNWEQELLKFCPKLRVKVLHPSRVAQPKQDNWDVCLTTYGMVSRHEELKETAWNLLVLDEAQAIKNHTTQASQAMQKLKARCIFALTGTPIENRLLDLWSIFSLCCPGLLGSYASFRELQQRADNAACVKNLVQPFLLRRMKTDKSVITDLPDKTELKSFCRLTLEQTDLYRQLIKELATALKDADEPIRRKGLVLSYLMKFKQLCNHPSQLLGDADFNPRTSSKFLRLKEIATKVAEAGEKMLVFTQFREITDILDAFLCEIFGQKGLILHGGTPVAQRQARLHEFQTKPQVPYFVLSLKAGGTGLNLTQARHVVHFDRWWNPAVENQATDRAFRIGQTRQVLVHKLICQGTIEDRIDAMIDHKKTLADGILSLSNEELLDWVQLDQQGTKADG